MSSPPYSDRELLAPDHFGDYPPSSDDGGSSHHYSSSLPHEDSPSGYRASRDTSSGAHLGPSDVTKGEEAPGRGYVGRIRDESTMGMKGSSEENLTKYRQYDGYDEYRDDYGDDDDDDQGMGRDERDPLRTTSSDNEDDGVTHYEQTLKKKSLPKRILGQPVVLLVFLSLLALMNYYDRGAFTGIIPIIGDEFDMSDSEKGIVAGAFIVGYSLVSPFMAQLSRYIPSGILLMIGMVVWVVATGLCALSTEFYHLVFLRCFVGIGEAAFICLSPSLIDDVAPPTQKTRWLAIFFSTLPIGYSLGYLGAGLLTKYLTWKWVFFIESAITLPLALLCIFLPNVRTLKSKENQQRSSPDSLIAVTEQKPASLYTSLKTLVKNAVYVNMTLGYCAQTFVLGALTFWLPDYVMEQYDLPISTANFVIGAVTAICGIFGNLVSSFLMDFLMTRKKKDGRLVGVYMSFIFTVIALPFAFIAVFMDTIYTFLVFMLGAEFFLLFTVTPVNSVFLNCVEPELRGHSVAVATLMIHLFGDLTSPYIFGAISDASGNQRYSLFFMSCWMIWSVMFWGAASFVIKRKVKNETNAALQVE